MPLKITVDEARRRGRAAAEQWVQTHGSGAAARARIENDFTWARVGYLGTAELDLGAALVAFSRERLAHALDLQRFPECRGLPDCVRAERAAFAEVCPDPLASAFHFDWYFFVSRRLNCRYVGRTPPPAQCTDFWFADTREGGPIHASNRDDVLFRYQKGHGAPPTRGGPAQHFTAVTCVGGVSSAVMCDDEPACLFPVNLEWLPTDDLKTVRQYMAFLERYRDFWGPGNRLYVDPELNFAAVEKANVRMGVRYSTGWAAITACAYLTPEMNAFHHERDLRSFQARGWDPNDNPDRAYWAGAERRYRRLLDLCEKEHRRGATLLGAAEIALDHAVPFPDRICIAGEKGHRDEKLQNWSMQSFARCISGPNRRMYYWHLDPTEPVPVYQTPCHIIPGEGVPLRPEWQREVAAAGEIGLHPAG